MIQRLAVFAALVTVLLQSWAGAQAPTDPWFTLTKLGPNVWGAIDNPNAKQRSYANAGVVFGEDGGVVVDTLTGDEAASHLLQEIRKLSTLPITFVIDTHYHGDHVAGNRLFADAGARVLAHRNVRTWIHGENIRMLGDTPNPDLISFIKRFAAPTVTYIGAIDLHLGSRTVQVRSFPGHTGGDSVVFVPDAGVAFAGDLLWRNMVPNTVDGTTAAWITTLDSLAKANAKYTFIPGHGDVANAGDVIAFRDYLGTVRTLVGDVLKQGKSGTALVEAVLPDLKNKYGQWDYFTFLAEPNIRDMEAELSGKKRVPQQ